MTDITIAQEPRWRAIVILLLGACAAWAPPFFYNVPADYLDFVLPWYGHILGYGPIEAFAHPFSNYSPPYLYLLSLTSLLDGPAILMIKTLSAISAGWAVYASYRLMRDLGIHWALEGAIATLILPTVVINVAFYGQADMFWIAPCLLALAAACRGNSLAMVAWAGLGFAFKAQAIFVAPFVIAMLLNRRAPWWHWTIPPAIYVVAILPAWLAGWPALDLLLVYVRQAQYVPANGLPFVSTASNPWVLFWVIDYWLAVHSYWIGFLAAVVATTGYIAWFARRSLSREQIALAALLSATMLPFLLPGMHERYFALAELVAFCWAASVRSRAAICVAAFLQVQFVLAFFGWVRSIPELTVVGSIFTTGVLWLLVQQVRERTSDKGGDHGQHVGEEHR